MQQVTWWSFLSLFSENNCPPNAVFFKIVMQILDIQGHSRTFKDNLGHDILKFLCYKFFYNRQEESKKVWEVSKKKFLDIFLLPVEKPITLSKPLWGF